VLHVELHLDERGHLRGVPRQCSELLFARAVIQLEKERVVALW
jgi:hypothetical protein